MPGIWNFFPNFIVLTILASNKIFSHTRALITHISSGTEKVVLPQTLTSKIKYIAVSPKMCDNNECWIFQNNDKQTNADRREHRPVSIFVNQFSFLFKYGNKEAPEPSIGWSIQGISPPEARPFLNLFMFFTRTEWTNMGEASSFIDNISRGGKCCANIQIFYQKMVASGKTPGLNKYS